MEKLKPIEIELDRKEAEQQKKGWRDGKTLKTGGDQNRGW